MTVREANELDRLMLLAGAGDETAFRRFYDLTSPAILAFLLRMLSDRFHAEDVLQEAMVIAWNKAHEFDPDRAAAKTWITTIARRRALDLLRSGKRRDVVFQGDQDDIRLVLGQDEATGTTSPESAATQQRLADCFGKLGSDAAACIQYAYLDGLTFVEIAEQIDRSLNTVKSWIRRGLDKLQACMQP